MKKKYSKILTLSVLTVGLLFPTTVGAADIQNNKISDLKNKIPVKMDPGTILKYDQYINPLIEHNDVDVQNLNQFSANSDEEVDIEGRAAEDEFFASVSEEAKRLGLPTVDLGYDLPNPEPGLVVIYGTDGLINRYYNELEVDANQKEEKISPLAGIPTTTVPYPGRLAPGVYNYGTNQVITITPGAVTGEGRFTVYRAGVGGSGSVGSSGKTLTAGDVATKRQVDNPKHNTAISARALNTNVVKTVFKNDIGTMPSAVLDVYFWGWNNSMFGYTYSDTLSFPGRYYYQY
ncbi:hypothetical protein I6G82_08950 [Lysinibacillus macroides]|uniref:hypothetical protein n=1 Tax=Lysinibacillus macroides TaxID=33935 RepID=UPI0006B5AF4C|nr:hypothetical protein [Lysinibacillus macroides]QPR69691.1 hypothetical protein I6G82_08950 [Lysinibacillus macroides]